MDSKLKLGSDPNSVWPELKLFIHAERGVYKFRFFLHGETSVIGQTGITRPLVSIFVKLNFIKKNRATEMHRGEVLKFSRDFEKLTNQTSPLSHLTV